MPNIPIAQDQVAGLIRHIVTVIGTLFVARGWAAGGYLDLVAGTLAAVGGAAWSYVAKLEAKPTPIDQPPAWQPPPPPPTPTLLMGVWKAADPGIGKDK